MGDLKENLLKKIQSYDKYCIRWDRVIDDLKDIYVYGWLSNANHKRGDFVLFTYNIDSKTCSILTSSADLSNKLNNDNTETVECVKFADYFQNQLK